MRLWKNGGEVQLIELEVVYKDGAFPLLELIARSNKSWQAAALKSTAWKVSSEIKKGIKSNAPGGKAYAPLSLAGQKRKALEMITGGKVRNRYTIMGQLRQAIGYEGKKSPTGVVPVGWLSSSAPYLGKKLQEGFETPVTPQLRRLYAAAGLKINKHKKFLKTPARPTLYPMEPQLAVTAKKWFHGKMLSYLSGNTARSKAASKRIYKVYK